MFAWPTTLLMAKLTSSTSTKRLILPKRWKTHSYAPRAHGVNIEDVPKFFDSNSRHSIYFPEDDVELPLQLHGPVSYLQVRYPTDEELNSCQHLELSCHDSPWEPMAFGQLPDYNREGSNTEHTTDFYQSLVASVRISAVSHDSYSSVTPEHLATKWGISLESAKQTIISTTQHIIRTTTGPVPKRYRTRAHRSRYRQLGGYLSTFASDTFSSKVKSLRGNNYVQLFCNRGNFVKSYPTKSLTRQIHS